MHRKAVKYIFADEENSISFVIPDKQVTWTSTGWIMDAMTTFQKLFQVVRLLNITVNLSLHITYCVFKEHSFALWDPWLGKHWLQQNKYLPLIFVKIVLHIATLASWKGILNKWIKAGFNQIREADVCAGSEEVFGKSRIEWTEIISQDDPIWHVICSQWRSHLEFQLSVLFAWALVQT